MISAMERDAVKRAIDALQVVLTGYAAEDAPRPRSYCLLDPEATVTVTPKRLDMTRQDVVRFLLALASQIENGGTP